MARVDSNSIFYGSSGKFGEYVYFQKNGKTFRAKARKNYRPRLTEKQKKDNDLFRRAVAFARSVIADPELKKVYKAKATFRQSAYTAAISEFMNTYRER